MYSIDLYINGFYSRRTSVMLFSCVVAPSSESYSSSTIRKGGAATL